MNSTGMAGHLIRRLHQRSTHVFMQRMQGAGYDLTSVQFAALDAICANPGLDQAHIAALIAYDKATIGGVIDRLEQKGLIVRTINKADRRSKKVELTEKGQKAHTNILPVVIDLQSDILEGLSGPERDKFLSLLRKVTTA